MSFVWVNYHILTEDPKEFRNIVLWLEDQKIRHYTIEDRANLRKVGSAVDWDPAYDKYKRDLKYPTDLKSKAEELTWLFLYAIKLEYSDNADRYRPVTAARKQEEEKKATSAPEIKSTNPFDNLDCEFVVLFDEMKSISSEVSFSFSYK